MIFTYVFQGKESQFQISFIGKYQCTFKDLAGIILSPINCCVCPPFNRIKTDSPR